MTGSDHLLLSRQAHERSYISAIEFFGQVFRWVNMVLMLTDNRSAISALVHAPAINYATPFGLRANRVNLLPAAIVAQHSRLKQFSFHYCLWCS